MSRPTYRIEHLCPVRNRWTVMMCWWGMSKQYAEGAFMVLRAGYGGSQRYRLVRVEPGGDQATKDGTVVNEWNTGEVKVS